MGGVMIKHRTGRYILVLFFMFLSAAVIPQKVFAQAERGIELYKAGEYQKAESTLQEALKAEPSNVTARYYLGLCALQQKKYGEALDVFLQVGKEQARTDRRKRATVPNEYQVQLALARAHLGLRQYNEAWKNLESARVEDMNSSDAYLYRGVYYYDQKKYAEAIKDLEKAISLDKNNTYAYYYAGLAYADSGNGAKAVDTLKYFLQLAPSAPEAAKVKALIDSLC